MVDPKFNKLPAPADGGRRKSAGAKPRRGLSINETIAADANKSIGAAGVDTSNITTGFKGNDPSARIDTEPVPLPFRREEVALRAFELWKERGSPLGSPEVDWKEAEQDLLARSRGSRAAVAGV
ncbi:MAG TPA: DUF2934 domain-containing protein [Bryobacteraceae bacterium]|jgi:hypothetical protein